MTAAPTTSPTTGVTPNKGPRIAPTRRLAVIVASLAAAGLALVVMLLSGGGAPKPPPPEIPDPGALTGWLLPVLSLLNVVLSVVVVGALMVPVLTLGRGGGDLNLSGYRAVRSIRVIAPVWIVVVVVQIWATTSDLFAIPIGQLDRTLVWSTMWQTNVGRSFVAQILLAAILAIGAWWTPSLRSAVTLLVVALGTVVPPALNGHSAASGSHDAAVASLIVHVLAATVWAGGLVALWWHLADRPTRLLTAAHRFAAVAAWAFGITAASGIVNALVRLGSPVELFTTDYGRGALVKIALLLAVGAVAVFTRRLALGRLAAGAGPAWRSLTSLSAVELVILAAAAGLGAALGRTPPPVGEIYTTFAEALIGRSMPPPPSVANLLFSFVPSGIGFAVVGFGAAGYIVGIVTLRRHGQRWSVGRTFAWFAGLIMVGYATFGGLGLYGMVMFSWHMTAHMVLTMLAPIFLVIGAPVNLALRALPGTDEDGGRGPRQWLAAVLRSRYVRLITHPIFASVMFVGSLYVVYFTGVFDVMMRNHLGHAFMQVHFLLSGVLFFELIVGEAPLPNRPGYLGRLLMMIAITPFHSFFAIAVMTSSNVIGGDYYSVLDRGYATDLLRDQYVGGSLTWAVGDVPMLIVAIVVVIQWYVSDSKTARRRDRQADRDHDAELDAYNRMLARLAESDEG